MSVANDLINFSTGNSHYHEMLGVADRGANFCTQSSADKMAERYI